MVICSYRKSGDWDLWVINAGRIKMDGGAMFGVVPKPLWEKCFTPDAQNRISLSLNCLLLRRNNQVILIETGFGGKVSDKQKTFYDLDESNGLHESLGQIGIKAGDISCVILTHLHQDHAGGCTKKCGDVYIPAFPNATYFVQQGEWEDAKHADAQTMKGYRYQDVMVPLEQAGVVNLLNGNAVIGPGIRVVCTPGHTRCHQSVIVETGVETICFIGDLIPTVHHMRPIYVMAYDLFPRETFVVKQKLMAQACSEKWIVVWGHDPQWPMSRVGRIETGDYFPVGV